MSSTKFQVFQNISPEKIKEEPNQLHNAIFSSTDEPIPHLITALPQYKQNHCTQFIQGTKFGNHERIKPHGNNGFLDTVLRCYNDHHNLVIRPDDIWIAILTQFSLYINANAEEFRDHFVNLKKKKELSIALPDYSSYNLFVKLMSKEIHKNLIDKEMKSWILPNFTTTTPDDVISCGVLFMATVKKYLDYSASMCCGIPWITLEGSVKDWEDILKRIEKLKSYKLDKWFNMLKPILEEFINAKKDKINLEFWQRICHYEAGGSGPGFMSGWRTSFCVFGQMGNWQGDGLRESK